MVVFGKPRWENVFVFVFVVVVRWTRGTRWTYRWSGWFRTGATTRVGDDGRRAVRSVDQSKR
jgi:hypothetical protein